MDSTGKHLAIGWAVQLGAHVIRPHSQAGASDRNHRLVEFNILEYSAMYPYEHDIPRITKLLVLPWSGNREVERSSLWVRCGKIAF